MSKLTNLLGLAFIATTTFSAQAAEINMPTLNNCAVKYDVFLGDIGKSKIRFGLKEMLLKKGQKYTLSTKNMRTHSDTVFRRNEQSMSFVAKGTETEINFFDQKKLEVAVKRADDLLKKSNDQTLTEEEKKITIGTIFSDALLSDEALKQLQLELVGEYGPHEAIRYFNDQDPILDMSGTGESTILVRVPKDILSIKNRLTQVLQNAWQIKASDEKFLFGLIDISESQKTVAEGEENQNLLDKKFVQMLPDCLKK